MQSNTCLIVNIQNNTYTNNTPLIPGVVTDGEDDEHEDYVKSDVLDTLGEVCMSPVLSCCLLQVLALQWRCSLPGEC